MLVEHMTDGLLALSLLGNHISLVSKAPNVTAALDSLATAQCGAHILACYIGTSLNPSPTRPLHSGQNDILEISSAEQGSRAQAREALPTVLDLPAFPTTMSSQSQENRIETVMSSSPPQSLSVDEYGYVATKEMYAKPIMASATSTGSGPLGEPQTQTTSEGIVMDSQLNMSQRSNGHKRVFTPPPWLSNFSSSSPEGKRGPRALHEVATTAGAGLIVVTLGFFMFG